MKCGTGALHSFVGASLPEGTTHRSLSYVCMRAEEAARLLFLTAKQQSYSGHRGKKERLCLCFFPITVIVKEKKKKEPNSEPRVSLKEKKGNTKTIFMFQPPLPQNKALQVNETSQRSFVTFFSNNTHLG